MNNLARITSLNRLLDPRYPTNLAIILLAMTAGAVIFIVEYISFANILAGLGSAVYAGFAVFFAWALSRELDPDHELSAFIGALLAFAAFFFLGSSNLLALLFMLMLLRMLVRTVGPPATLLDTLLIVALGGWLALHLSIMYGFSAAVGLFLDGFLINSLRRQLYFAIVMFLFTLLTVFVIGIGNFYPEFLNVQALIVMFTVLLFIPFVFSYRAIKTTSDRDSLLLFPARLRAAQLLTLLTCLGTWILGGTAAMVQLMPLWAALLGVSIYFVCQTLIKHFRPYRQDVSASST